MNEETKPWYRSKTFLGLLMAVVLYAMRTLGVVDVDDPFILKVACQGGEFAGILIGLVGRTQARTRLTLGSSSVGREA
jgi:hypothetical protein